MTSPKRVLIVDDEPQIADVLAEALTGQHTVEIAANGPDALSAVARARPDLVLLDMNMPGMSGLDVLQSLQVIDRTIRVIMVTATGDNDAIAASLSAGAFSYIPKPFNVKYIQHLVAAALAERSKRAG
jgi:DNA-binding NtrC family response regulator